MFFCESERGLKHENVFREKRMMLFFKWTVIRSGLFFPLAFLFLITLQDSFTEKKD